MSERPRELSEDDLAKVKKLFGNDRVRFMLELEFVELLANPWYLHNLAQSKYLEHPRFLNYLAYLQYWRQPEYLKFISRPHCLYFLELLQRKEFRQLLMDPEYINLIHTNQYWHWRYFRWNRYRERHPPNLDLVAEGEQQPSLDPSRAMQLD